jgi:hypothetical protein
MPEMRLKKIIINHPKKSLEEIKKIAEEKKAKFMERAQKWGQKFMGDSSRSPSWKHKSVERPPWKCMMNKEQAEKCWKLKEKVEKLQAIFPHVEKKALWWHVKAHSKNGDKSVEELIPLINIKVAKMACNFELSEDQKAKYDHLQECFPRFPPYKLKRLVAKRTGLTLEELKKVVVHKREKFMGKMAGNGSVSRSRSGKHQRFAQKTDGFVKVDQSKRPMTEAEREKFRALRELFPQFPEQRLRRITKNNTSLDVLGLSELIYKRIEKFENSD